MKVNEKGEIMPDRIEELKVPKIFKASLETKMMNFGLIQQAKTIS